VKCVIPLGIFEDLYSGISGERRDYFDDEHILEEGKVYSIKLGIHDVRVR